MNEILIALAGLITIGGSAFFGWVFARRKYNAESKVVEVTANTTEIENESKIIDLYKDALNDLPVRYEEKYKHVELMSLKIEELFQQKEKILMQEIEYHKKQAALYKKMYDDKVKEFNLYKKLHP